MRKRIIVSILISTAAVVVTLALIEFSLSVMAKFDAINPFLAMGYSLETEEIRIDELRARLENFLANVKSAKFQSDAKTGWTLRPNAILSDGRLTTNSIGIRSRREFTGTPAPDTLRVAAFGDSFTLGIDVDDDDVWTQALEAQLGAHGIRAEVLNFGVGGYGMDQAYLRWQHLGKDFKPDIVIFGFQSENLQRNVSVFRPIYARHTGIPLSKPRYVLEDGDLNLINFPAVQPNHLMEVYEDFDRNPLSAYEYYYSGDKLTADWWPFPRIAVLIQQAIAKPREPGDGFGPESERGQLGKAIIDAFAHDVAESSASFMVVHLPVQGDLASHHNGVQPSYAFLLDHFANTYLYVPIDELLGPQYVEPRYWGGTGHYGPEINQIVGDELAVAIVNCIDDGTCPLPRFNDMESTFLKTSSDEG